MRYKSWERGAHIFFSFHTSPHSTTINDDSDDIPLINMQDQNQNSTSSSKRTNQSSQPTVKIRRHIQPILTKGTEWSMHFEVPKPVTHEEYDKITYTFLKSKTFCDPKVASVDTTKPTESSKSLTMTMRDDNPEIDRYLHKTFNHDKPETMDPAFTKEVGKLLLHPHDKNNGCGTTRTVARGLLGLLCSERRSVQRLPTCTSTNRTPLHCVSASRVSHRLAVRECTLSARTFCLSSASIRSCNRVVRSDDRP